MWTLGQHGFQYRFECYVSEGKMLFFAVVFFLDKLFQLKKGSAVSITCYWKSNPPLSSIEPKSFKQVTSNSG